MEEISLHEERWREGRSGERSVTPELFFFIFSLALSLLCYSALPFILRTSISCCLCRAVLVMSGFLRSGQQHSLCCLIIMQ